MPLIPISHIGFRAAFRSIGKRAHLGVLSKGNEPLADAAGVTIAATTAARLFGFAILHDAAKTARSRPASQALISVTDVLSPDKFCQQLSTRFGLRDGLQIEMRWITEGC